MTELNKISFAVTLLCLSACSSSAPTNQQRTFPGLFVTAEGDSIHFTSYPLDELPEPMGGVSSIFENLVYPTGTKNIQGIVYVECLLNENGDVSHTRIERGLRKDLDDAVATAIRSTKFKPGRFNGAPVMCRMLIPVRF